MTNVQGDEPTAIEDIPNVEGTISSVEEDTQNVKKNASKIEKHAHIKEAYSLPLRGNGRIIVDDAAILGNTPGMKENVPIMLETAPVKRKNAPIMIGTAAVTKDNTPDITETTPATIEVTHARRESTSSIRSSQIAPEDAIFRNDTEDGLIADDAASITSSESSPYIIVGPCEYLHIFIRSPYDLFEAVWNCFGQASAQKRKARALAREVERNERDRIRRKVEKERRLVEQEVFKLEQWSWPGTEERMERYKGKLYRPEYYSVEGPWRGYAQSEMAV